MFKYLFSQNRRRMILISILLVSSLTFGLIIKIIIENLNCPVIKLRTTPIILESQSLAAKTFQLNQKFRPLHYNERDHFIENADKTICDPSTFLMWQKNGSEKPLNFNHAKAYILHLNKTNDKGYNDWRLPTIDELLSLLEREKGANQLYINPIYNIIKPLFWSSDTLAAKTPFGINENSAWGVDYRFGYVYWAYFKAENYVRAVRSF